MTASLSRPFSSLDDTAVDEIVQKAKAVSALNRINGQLAGTRRKRTKTTTFATTTPQTTTTADDEDDSEPDNSSGRFSPHLLPTETAFFNLIPLLPQCFSKISPIYILHFNLTDFSRAFPWNFHFFYELFMFYFLCHWNLSTRSLFSSCHWWKQHNNSWMKRISSKHTATRWHTNGCLVVQSSWSRWSSGWLLELFSTKYSVFEHFFVDFWWSLLFCSNKVESKNPDLLWVTIDPFGEECILSQTSRRSEENFPAVLCQSWRDSFHSVIKIAHWKKSGMQNK